VVGVHLVRAKNLMCPAGRCRVDENGGAHVARRRRFGLALRDREGYRKLNSKK
jgi:hypothetical protein